VPKRRTRLEIYFDVLRAIKNGNGIKTRMMHAANISGHRLNEILNSLICQGFIEELKTLHWSDKKIRVTYDFTPKGEKITNYLEYTEEFLSEMDLKELFRNKDTKI
jgi:predicted transcriptional regulator